MFSLLRPKASKIPKDLKYFFSLVLSRKTNPPQSQK
ncbi:hypothetical protein CLOLEP_02055 [[Clostridium] leptum DSM 753]|uniref:Uncharacterized protein n=1 Tax=[Clostridium] leptum DSM 753 TaxID=428125 RepID=A7VU09_9FIRM|nr:hypothetical protein CLOLEP_02055 [[Clostridium] leptum DSM 753]